ncbi:MAG TPA: tetratricopeptide repeat-containing protein [Cyanobacteria bacterium UBA8553]|nr:tetratricopeptide repeat-containing protein [Cyanobacteria bacterium UBA8553]HAJ62338.1 tetratricopeptide repeat-containing protein [Cyanobacteria bacterium UBA8543]
MLKDYQGLEVTTDSLLTIAAIDRYTDQALAYGKDAVAIFQGIEADEECAIANAHAAAFYLSHESTQSHRKAVPYLEAARRYKHKTTEREQLFISAVEAWEIGAIDQSIAYTEELAEKYPRDLIAVQLGQYHYFYQGNKEALLKIAEKVLPANRENHYLHGMIAFGLEQCHRLDEAEAVGRMAVAMDRNDPWAQHAVAHVMEMQGRLEEGIAWMESHSDTWENCNSMLYTHNWWHVALYYLEKEDIQNVLQIYDAHLWGRAWKESPKDQVGVISLLLRLELRGIDVGGRWQELVPYLIGRIHEHALPFNDLHYVYALARAGQAELVTEMLLSMQAYADAANPFIKQTWNEIAVPTARGLAAHAQGEWEKASGYLGITVHRLQAIGGSHAQRDLFEQVYLDGWLRASQNHEALRLLEKRIAAHRYVPSVQREPALRANKQELVQFSAQNPTEKAVATLSKAENVGSADLAIKSRVITKPNQPTHWTEQLSQFQKLSLATTYARIIEMGGHLSA